MTAFGTVVLLPEDEVARQMGSRNYMRRAKDQAATERPDRDRPRSIPTPFGTWLRAPGKCSEPTCGRVVEFRAEKLGTCALCTPWWQKVIGPEHAANNKERERRKARDAAAVREDRKQRRTDRDASRRRSMLGGGPQ